jgi:hypothetical protein
MNKKNDGLHNFIIFADQSETEKGDYFVKTCIKLTNNNNYRKIEAIEVTEVWN